MSHTQRYGELNLIPRLASHSTSDPGHNHSDYILWSLKSYEENRLESMAEAKDSAASAKESIADSAAKRICVEVSLRDATRMTKVVVGDEKAEWMVHEKSLLANSGFARAAITHDTVEKSSGTIFLPAANPESFDVFHKYLYEKRLGVAKLDLDQLLMVYVLADYVDCPIFADLVFEEIHTRTSSPSFMSYTHKQIHYVLTSTLPDQPLHKLLLDQVSRQILQKKHDFNSEEAHDTLDQVMSDLLVALVKTINTIGVTTFGSSQVPIENYSKHVSRHLSSKDVPNGAQPAKRFETVPRLGAGESAESQIGRKAIELVMSRSGTTKEDATKALEDNGYDTEKATGSLMESSCSFGYSGGNPFGGGGTSFFSTIPSAPPNSSTLAAITATPNTPTPTSMLYPNPATPASSHGRGVARGAGGAMPGRGATPRGRGAFRGGACG